MREPAASGMGFTTALVGANRRTTAGPSAHLFLCRAPAGHRAVHLGRSRAGRGGQPDAPSPLSGQAVICRLAGHSRLDTTFQPAADELQPPPVGAADEPPSEAEAEPPQGVEVEAAGEPRREVEAAGEPRREAETADEPRREVGAEAPPQAGVADARCRPPVVEAPPQAVKAWSPAMAGLGAVRPRRGPPDSQRRQVAGFDC